MENVGEVFDHNRPAVKALVEYNARQARKDDSNFPHLCATLHVYYRAHDPALLPKVYAIAVKYKSMKPRLFRLLKDRYGVDVIEATGLDANHPVAAGSTALLLASYRNYPLIVAFLVEMGADLAIKDDNGRTALDYAIEKDHAEIVDILTNAAAPSVPPALAAGAAAVLRELDAPVASGSGSTAPNPTSQIVPMGSAGVSASLKPAGEGAQTVPMVPDGAKGFQRRQDAAGGGADGSEDYAIEKGHAEIVDILTNAAAPSVPPALAAGAAAVLRELDAPVANGSGSTAPNPTSQIVPMGSAGVSASIMQAGEGAQTVPMVPDGAKGFQRRQDAAAGGGAEGSDDSVGGVTATRADPAVATAYTKTQMAAWARAGNQLLHELGWGASAPRALSTGGVVGIARLLLEKSRYAGVYPTDATLDFYLAIGVAAATDEGEDVSGLRAVLMGLP